MFIKLIYFISQYFPLLCVNVVLRSLDQFKGMLSLPKTGVAKKKKKKPTGGCFRLGL